MHELHQLRHESLIVRETVAVQIEHLKVIQHLTEPDETG